MKPIGRELMKLAVSLDVHSQVRESDERIVILVHVDTPISASWPTHWQGKPIKYGQHSWPKWVTEPWWRVNDETLEWEDTRDGKPYRTR